MTSLSTDWRMLWRPELFEWSEATPFGSLRWPLGAIALYLVVIVVGRRSMRSRAAFPMRVATSAHNALLCAWSLLMLVGVALAAARQMSEWGVLRVWFCETDESRFRGPLIYWTYIFYLSKFYELVDTIIIILKKKPLILLHYYHHILALLLSWVNLQATWPQFWFCVLCNSAIHSIMYFYYAATALGYRVWWKKYLTRLQLLQFVIFLSTGLICMFLMLFARYTHCVGSIWAPLLNNIWIVTLIWLFLLFYKRVYAKKSTGTANSSQSNGAENESESQKNR